MDESNMRLLEEVSESRLKTALNHKADADERKLAFTEAMQVADRQIELSKLEDARQEKLREEELKKAESKKSLIIHCAEIGIGVILAPVIDFFCKKALAKLCIAFEEHGTLTTTPGRSLSSMFRFKK